MKKIIVVIFAILVLGVAYYFGKDYLSFGNNKLEELGYSKESAKKINELNLDLYLNNVYYKTVDEALKQDLYVNDYLEYYIKINYINNENFISIVNDLLKNNYTVDDINNLSGIISSNYFINDYLKRYINYKKSNTNISDENIVIYVNIGLDNDFYTNIRTIEKTDDLLILVNKYSKLPDDYSPDDLIAFDSSYTISTSERKMKKVAHDALVKLIDDIRSKGMNLWINSTFRTSSYQNTLFTNSVKNNGMDHALKYSAKMRHSEHETGLAVDMSSVKGMLDGFENYKEYDWLQDNAYKYGFILRYPLGKEFITGYAYESWHYRYVGVDAATIIHNEDITFEEYAVKYLKYY